MSVFKKLRRKRDAWFLSAGKKILITLAICLCTALGMTVLMLFLRQHSILGMWEVLKDAYPWSLISTVLFFFLITAALSFFTRSVFVGSLIPCVLFLILFEINYFKLLITSTPLQFSDLSLMFQVGEIAQLNAASITFSWHDIGALLAVALWLTAVFFFAGTLRLKWAPTLIGGGAAALSFILLFVVFVNAAVFEPIGVGVSQRRSAAYAERYLGLPLSLWRSVISGGGTGIDDYSEEMMKALLSQVEAYASEEDFGKNATEENPNIILFLSESFFDITSLDNLTFRDDPLAIYREIAKESVSGTFYAPTLGYGTSNIELNILTGINPELMNVDESPCNWYGHMFDYLPAIPRILSDNGYYTASLHTFNDSIYNRRNYFYNLGFQDTYFSGDFAEIETGAAEAAAEDDYWGYMQTKLSGGSYSDDYLADVIIDLHKKKDDDGPVFLFAFTMENHSPYTEKRNGDGFDFSTTADITDEAEEVIGNIAQGMYNSTQALQKLVDYFSAVDEPTMIIFFGDHRPGGGLTDNSSIYTQLGLVPADVADWSTEQKAEFYSTSYLIWANDDSLLPAERGSKAVSSANTLGLSMLEAAGAQQPLWWRFVKSVSTDTAFFSWSYYVSADGTVSNTPDLKDGTRAANKLSLMSSLLSDAFYGKQYVTKDLWKMAEAP